MKLAVASLVAACLALAISSFALGVAVGRHVERASIERVTIEVAK